MTGLEEEIMMESYCNPGMAPRAIHPVCLITR